MAKTIFLAPDVIEELKDNFRYENSVESLAGEWFLSDDFYYPAKKAFNLHSADGNWIELSVENFMKSLDYSSKQRKNKGNIFKEFKPGLIVEYIGDYNPNYSKGRIGIVKDIPEYTHSCTFNTFGRETHVTAKNSCLIYWYYHPNWGNGIESYSVENYSELRILSNVYYYDFKDKKVRSVELNTQYPTDCKDYGFVFHLLRQNNCFTTVSEAEQYGRTRTWDLNNLLKSINKK